MVVDTLMELGKTIGTTSAVSIVLICFAFLVGLSLSRERRI